MPGWLDQGAEADKTKSQDLAGSWAHRVYRRSKSSINILHLLSLPVEIQAHILFFPLFFWRLPVLFYV